MSASIILAIDIGNSAVRFGVFEDSKLQLVDQATHQEISIAEHVHSWLQEQHVEQQIEAVSVCSVVPDQTTPLSAALKTYLGVEPKIMGENLDSGLINRYRDPSSVGGDRLASARAAWDRFQSDVIVVDYGTALTVDLVTAEREYVGGAIAPGLRMGLTALASKTALLPDIDLSQPTELLGADTRSSLLSGVIRGSAELARGLIDAIRQERGIEIPFLLTGGEAEYVAPWLPEAADFDTNLTLKGLAAATVDAHKMIMYDQQ